MIRLAGPHQLGLISAILILAGLAAAQAARTRIIRAKPQRAAVAERVSATKACRTE